MAGVQEIDLKRRRLVTDDWPLAFDHLVLALRPFRYRHLGEVVSLGRDCAVAEIKGVRFDGLPAWLVWRAFYLSQPMGLKNRAAVLVD